MNEGVYDGLSDAHRAAVDAAIGIPLSQSAEEAWIAKGEEAVTIARADGDNVVIDLTAEEIAVVAEAVSGVTQAYVDAVGGADTLAAMTSN